MTLVWEALAEIDTSYKVFVHALNADGTIIGQSDTFPAEGARPTTGWLPGEFVTDPHTIHANPADVTALRIGFYELETGRSLTPPGGERGLVLPLP